MSKYNNVPVSKIGLTSWLKEHRLNPGDAFKYKGKTHVVSPIRVLHELNALQKRHLRGTIDVYALINTFTQAWHHDRKKPMHWFPIEGTEKPATLPPIYIQWKDDYRKRYGQQR